MQRRLPVQLERSPEAALVALLEAAGGDWRVDGLDGDGLRAEREAGEVGLAVELIHEAEGWVLLLCAYRTRGNGLRTGLTVAIAGALGLAAAWAAWQVVPLGFQLALPIAGIVGGSTFFGTAALAPLLVGGGEVGEPEIRGLLDAVARVEGLRLG